MKLHYAFSLFQERLTVPVLRLILGSIALMLSGLFSAGQITAQTQTVKLNLIVNNDSNQPVVDLRPEDVQVSDEGVVRPISILTKDERPLAYAAVVDTSGSFRTLLEPALRAVRALIESNRPGDEMMLVKFVSIDQIKKIKDFTADKGELLNSLKSFRPEGGQSAVIDAVYYSVQETAKYKADDEGVHRAVILISDGEDRRSSHSEEELVRLLRENDVQVFVVGIVTQLDDEGGLIRRSPRQKAEELLKRISGESGWRLAFPDTDGDMVKLSSEIIRDLHTQYRVVFERPVQTGDKGFRKIKIKLNESAGGKKVKVIARPGYRTGVQTTPPPADKKSP